MGIPLFCDYRFQISPTWSGNVPTLLHENNPDHSPNSSDDDSFSNEISTTTSFLLPDQSNTHPFAQKLEESRMLTTQIIASIKLPSETIYFRPLIIQMFKALPQLQCKKLLVQNFMYNLNELIKRLMLVWLSYSAIEDDARAPVYFAECRATLEHIQDVTRNCPVPSLQMEHLDNFHVWFFKRLAYTRAIADAGQVCDRCISSIGLDPELAHLRKRCQPFATSSYSDNTIQEISLAFTATFHQQLLKTIQSALPSNASDCC